MPQLNAIPARIADTAVQKSLNRVFFEILQPESFNAGRKPLDDVNSILLKEGFSPIRMDRSKSPLGRLLRAPMCLARVGAALLSRKNLVVIQSPPPFEVRRPLQMFIRLKRAAVVVLVHDLEAVHDTNKSHELKAELQFLGSADAVVCHNLAMKQWLRQAGLTNPIHYIDFFDYLVAPGAGAADERAADVGAERWRSEIVFAGNLSPNKSGFIYDLPEKLGVGMRVFGSRPGAEISFPACITYAGRFPPNSPTLPHGSFGLVWDGPETTRCSGALGEYLKLNSPHKASLYLASAMPIICWRQSALAAVIEQKQLGFSVESVLDIPDVLAALPLSDYEAMLVNVEKIRGDICGGRQFMRALRESISNVTGSRSPEGDLVQEYPSGLQHEQQTGRVGR
jgi:hypothetical protein